MDTFYLIVAIAGGISTVAAATALLMRPIRKYTMTPEQIERADIDHDGKIAPLDYILAKRIVFGTYTPQDNSSAESSASAVVFGKGDKVMLNDGVKTYADGDPIADWVKGTTLYVRDTESDGTILLVSTEKTKKDYTGRVKASDVHRV